MTLLCFGVPRSPGDVAALRSFCEHVDFLRAHATARKPADRARGPLPSARYSEQTQSPRMKSLVAAHVRAARRGDRVPGGRGVVPVGMARRARIFEEVEVGVYRDAPLAASSPLRRARLRLAWWNGRFVRGLVNSFDRSTVVSGIERDHLMAIGCDSSRIEVVPNGTTAADVFTPRERHVSRLIYPGPVTYSANLDAVRYFVHEILPLVRRVRPDVTFVVTGSTDGVDVGDLEAEDGVSFTGRLADINAILAESAACVVPLRIGGGTRLEGASGDGARVR